jgi:cytidylate kinase
MIAKKHGYDESALAASDEKLTSPFFDSYFPYGTESGGISEKLFLLQANIIKEEAEKGSGIFIGRCANDVLREFDNVISIFIYAPKADRIQRIMEVDGISEPAAAEKIIKRMDKTRRSYYQFYTDKRWGTTDDMDLMINSSALGIDGSVNLIEDFLYRGGYAV